ncbi:TPA: hypothetical protein ACYUTM_001227 [Serratia marcescens]
MSKKLDLKEPLTKKIIERMNIHFAICLDNTLQIEKCVNSVLFPIKNEMRPEAIGSGVFVHINGEYFLFSASHVFDEIGSYQLLMSCEGERYVTTFKGERFSSAKGLSGKHIDDPYDSSVFHIQDDISDNIKKLSLNYDDLDIIEPDSFLHSYVVSGFYAKKAKFINGAINCSRASFGTNELPNEVYSLLGINREWHISLSYEKDTISDGRYTRSPTPLGFSGGGIFKFSSFDLTNFNYKPKIERPKLSAITIEHRKEKGSAPGVLIGSRIKQHLALIKHYLPGFLDNK